MTSSTTTDTFASNRYRSNSNSLSALSKVVHKWTVNCFSATTFAPLSPGLTPAIFSSFSNAYKSIAELIHSFGEVNSLHRIDEEGIKSANYFLNQLIAADVPAPKVFPSGGEAVVFVWDRLNSREYLHYDDEVVTLTHMPHVGDELQTDIKLSDPGALTSLVLYLRA